MVPLRCGKQALPHPFLGVVLVPIVLSVSVACSLVFVAAFGLFLLFAGLFVSLNLLFLFLFPTQA